MSIVDPSFEMEAGDPQMLVVQVGGALDLLGPLSLSPLDAPWAFGTGDTPQSAAGIAGGGSTLLTGLTGTADGAQLLVLINDASAQQTVTLDAGYYTLSALFGVPTTSSWPALAVISIAGIDLVVGGGDGGTALYRHESLPFKVATAGEYALRIAQTYNVAGGGGYFNAQVVCVDGLVLAPYPVVLGRVGTVAAPTRDFQVTGWGDGTMPPSGPGALITPPVPPRVRLRGSNGVSWWEHDGNTFSVYDAGVRTLKAPLPTCGGTPELVVAVDPLTNLPSKYPFPTLDAPPPPLPAGGYGDLVWFNGTDWVVLVPTAIEGDTLELVDTGGAALQPLWGGGDRRNNIMAGAEYLTEALNQAYNVTMSIIKAELQAAITAGLIAGTSLTFGGLKSILLASETALVSAAVGVLVDIFDLALDFIDAILGALLGPLAPEVIHNLRLELYQVLEPQLGSSTITFGAGEQTAWQAAIDLTSSATDPQKAVLKRLIGFYSLEKWDYWLRTGQLGKSSHWQDQVYE